MNADGSGQRRLTRNPARDNDPVWSPDGRRIAFDSGRQDLVDEPQRQRQTESDTCWLVFGGRSGLVARRAQDRLQRATVNPSPWDLRHERRWQRAATAGARWREPCLVARRDR